MTRGQNFIITIDGPAGVGKSTAAKMLARRLDAVFLDTGAMYRAVTLAAVERGIDPADTPKRRPFLTGADLNFAAKKETTKVFIDGQDKTAAIRDPKLTEQIKFIAAAPSLRGKLVQMQQDFAAGCQRIVTEGRDQGTVAFPDADVKFFMTADAEERARRRHRELLAAGKDISLTQVLSDQKIRDASDENRTVGPLKPAADAVMINTTSLTIEQVVGEMERIAGERIRAGKN